MHRNALIDREITTLPDSGETAGRVLVVLGQQSHSMPSVVALRRWLVVVALLRLLSGEQASLRLACEFRCAIGHVRLRHNLEGNVQRL